MKNSQISFTVSLSASFANSNSQESEMDRFAEMTSYLKESKTGEFEFSVDREIITIAKSEVEYVEELLPAWGMEFNPLVDIKVNYTISAMRSPLSEQLVDPIATFQDFVAQMKEWKTDVWAQINDQSIVVKTEDLTFIGSQLAGWGLEVVSSSMVGDSMFQVTVKVWEIISSEDQICIERFALLFPTKAEAEAYVADRYCSWETYSINEVDPYEDYTPSTEEIEIDDFNLAYDLLRWEECHK